VSISKKTRFEVFKRDGFECQYCGNCPPGVVLEVDHITPKKLKGSNDVDNLITSCFDCNRGKGARDLKIAPPKTDKRLKDIKEKEDQLKALYRYQDKIKKRIENDIDYLDSKWWDELSGEEGKYCFTAHARRQIKNLLRTFSRYEIEEAMEIAWTKPHLKDRFAYMCGILWTTKRNKEEK